MGENYTCLGTQEWGGHLLNAVNAPNEWIASTECSEPASRPKVSLYRTDEISFPVIRCIQCTETAVYKLAYAEMRGAGFKLRSAAPDHCPQ